MRQQKKKSIAVIGLGYVGLPLAVLAARKRYRVIGVDINKERIEIIKSKKSPFHDARLARALKSTTIEATVDFASAREASIIVVCVPTPIHHNHKPDLRPLIGACEGLAPHLSQGSLVVIESTVNPGICDSVVCPILEKESGMKAGVDFDLSHCPERINPGDEKWNVENINRVAGSLCARGLKRTLRFYRSLITADIRPMHSLKEAEAVKIVENTFRDINIAFVNELALSFSRLDIDILHVLEGARTKPFAFMPHYPSCGVGGHCIPVDPYYLIHEGKRNGFSHRFLSLARTINNEMPFFTVDLLEKTMQERGLAFRGARIAVLGLSYKANIDDVRESPSFKIVERIVERGATPITFDPFVNKLSTVGSLKAALSGASAAIIATAHRPFLRLTPADFLRSGVSVVIDGKNCLPKEAFTRAGITYRGIGR